MGSPRQQEQKELRTDFWSKYKARKIEKAKADIQYYNESSNSAIFFHNFFNKFLDIIMWGIIAFFVYVWWSTGQYQDIELTCKDITMDMCRICFGG